MFFQYVLKGISGIGHDEARYMLCKSGIACNWLRNTRHIFTEEIPAKLTVDSLDWHLHWYDRQMSDTHKPFRESTPYISTSAGTVEPDHEAEENYVWDAFYTAVWYATEEFKTSGFVYYGYVYTLGKQAIPLREFAEEVRDLHVYPSYMPYRREGEVVAKLHIPATRLRRCEWYSGPKAEEDFIAGRRPYLRSTDILENPDYKPPEPYSNVRGML